MQDMQGPPAAIRTAHSRVAHNVPTVCCRQTFYYLRAKLGAELTGHTLTIYRFVCFGLFVLINCVSSHSESHLLHKLPK